MQALAGKEVAVLSQALIDAIDRNKPSGAKGRYWRSLYVTSTMGPSVEVDFSALQDIKQEG